jgi:Chaperone of endosialidase/Protein of unknown function (DUF2793)
MKSLSKFSLISLLTLTLVSSALAAFPSTPISPSDNIIDPVATYGPSCTPGSVNCYVLSSSGTSLASGTASNTTLRWNGSAWVESTALTLDANNATTTGVLSTNALTSNNATSSSLFASVLNAIAAAFTNLFATNATITNSTSTNLYVANLNSATSTFNGVVILNSSVKDSFGATGTVGQLLSSTGTSTKWINVASNGALASGTATSSTLRWDGTNWVENTSFLSDSNNATVTSKFVVLGTSTLATTTSTNLFATILNAITATINNLLFTNATGTNITATDTAYLANISATNTNTQNIVSNNATNTSLFTVLGTSTLATTAIATLTSGNTIITGTLSSATSSLATSTVSRLTVSGNLFVATMATGTASDTIILVRDQVTGEIKQTTLAAVTSSTTGAITFATTSGILTYTLNGIPSTTTLDNFANLTIGTSTITNLLSTNSTNTNSTSTNLFATLLNSITAIFTNLFATNATITNSTSTSISTTNLASTYTNAGQLVAGTSTLATTTITLLTVSGNSNVNGNFTVLSTTTLATTSISALLDSTGNLGLAGQYLQTTGTSTKWTSIAAASSATGSIGIVQITDGQGNLLAASNVSYSTTTGTFTVSGTTTLATTSIAYATILNGIANLSDATINNATVTNSTSTNLFATLLNSITAIFTNLFATNATITNSTSTNLSTTNLASAYTNAGQLVAGTSTLATTTISKLIADNAIINSLIATTTNTQNIISVNSTTTGNKVVTGTTTLATATISNLIINGLQTGSVTAGNITATNTLTAATTTLATTTSTNLFADVFNSILATITNLLFTNATGTNLVASNINAGNVNATNTLTFLNASGTNATATNLFSNFFTSLNGFFTNLVGTNATFVNATTTNFVATGTSTQATTSVTAFNAGNTNINGNLNVTLNSTLSGDNTVLGTSTLATTSISNLIVSGLTTSNVIAGNITATNTLTAATTTLATTTASKFTADNVTATTSNSLISNVTGTSTNNISISTTSSVLANFNVLGTTTLATTTSTNLFATILNAITSTITNLFFTNATGTNLTITGTTTLATNVQSAAQGYSSLVVGADGVVRKAPVINTLSDVLDNNLATPPAVPGLDDSYLLSTSSPLTGAWVGATNTVATWNGTSWNLYTPAANDKTTVTTGANAGVVYVYNGSVWSVQAVQTSNTWLLGGNGATSTQTLGTTLNGSVSLVASNTQRILLNGTSTNIFGLLNANGTTTLATTTATGLTLTQNGLTLAPSTVATTTDTLYNNAGTLFFNGVAVGSGGSTSSPYTLNPNGTVALASTTAVLTIASTTVATTTNALYNQSGILYWNGAQLSGLSGVNTTSFVYDEDIVAGQLVQINANGRVSGIISSVAGASTTIVTTGSPITADTGNNDGVFIKEVDASTVAMGYRDVGTGLWYTRIGTVSLAVTTWGPAVQVTTGGTQLTDIVAMPSYGAGNKLVYLIGNAGSPNYRVGTFAGNNVSLAAIGGGLPGIGYGGQSYYKGTEVASSKIAIIGYYPTTGNVGGYIVACTIGAGDTLTCGGQTNGGNTRTQTSVIKAQDTSIAKAATDKVIVSYGGNNSTCFFNIVTFSGTTATWGGNSGNLSPQETGGCATTATGITDRVIQASSQGTGGDLSVMINASTPASIGTQRAIFPASGTNGANLVDAIDTTRTVFGKISTTGNFQMVLATSTASGLSATNAGAIVTVTSSAGSVNVPGFAIAALPSGIIVTAYYDTAATGDVVTKNYVLGSTNNIVAPGNAYGIAQATGATSTANQVTLMGGVSTAHTGLVSGSLYYIQANGTLGTVATPYLMGRAISATALSTEVGFLTSNGGTQAAVSSTLISDPDGNTFVAADFLGNNEDKIRFNTAGTLRMIIDSNGNIGINAGTNPTALLDIRATSTSAATLFSVSDMTGATSSLVANGLGQVAIGTSTFSTDGTRLTVGGSLALKSSAINGITQGAVLFMGSATSSVASTTNALYNLNGVLYFNGQQLYLGSTTTPNQVIASFLSGSLTANQTLAAANTDHACFNSVSSSFGSDITLDTTSACTTGSNPLNVPNRGRITLKAGKTYELIAYPNTIGGPNAAFEMVWENADTGVAISGRQAVYANNASWGTTNNPVNTIFTPSSDTRVQLRHNYTPSGLSQTLRGDSLNSFSGTNDSGASTFMVKVLAGASAVTGQSVDYIEARKTGNQAVTAGTDMTFVNQAGNIAFDGTSVTLIAGKTYELIGSLRIASFTAGAGSATYGWVDSLNNPIAGATGGVIIPDGANNGTTQGIARAIITPSSNQTVKLRITAANTNTGADVGSYITVKQLGTSAMTSETIWSTQGNSFNAGSNYQLGTLSNSGLQFTASSSVMAGLFYNASSSQGVLYLGSTTPSTAQSQNFSFYANNTGGFISTTTNGRAINSLYIGTSSVSSAPSSATNTNISLLDSIQLYIDGAVAKLAKKTVNGTDIGAALVIDSATSSVATTTNALYSLNGKLFYNGAEIYYGSTTTPNQVIASFMRAVATTSQGTSPYGVAGGNHIATFAVDAQYGSDISLNTTSPYTVANGAPSIGRFTLKAGKTYDLRGSIGYITGSAGNYLAFAFFNTDTGIQIGTSGSVDTRGNSTTDQLEGYQASAIFTPSADMNLELRITTNNAVTGIGSASWGLPTVDIKVIAGNAAVTGTSVDYINVVKLTPQTITVPTDITFTTQAGNIQFDGTNFTLIAGKTYKVDYAITAQTGGTNAYPVVQFVNSSNVAVNQNKTLGLNVGFIGGVGGGVGGTQFTPTVTGLYKLRVTNTPSGGSVTIEGGSVDYGLSYVNITQLGSSALTSESIVNNGGNTGTNVTIGTLTDKFLAFVASSTERMRILTNGMILVGTSTQDTAFATSSTLFGLIGNINSYIETNIKNTSTGTSAQAGYTATANTGTASSNFLYMGINNSGFSATGTTNVGGALDANILSLSNDMYIANGTVNKSLIFMTGGTATSTNSRMTIAGNGAFALGTSTISGSFNLQAIATSSPIFSLASSTGANVFRVNANGTVAIGTSTTQSENILTLGPTPAGASPTAEGGQLMMLPGTSFSTSWGQDNYEGNFRLLKANGAGISNTTVLFVASSTNYIGIGTALPAFRLDVSDGRSGTFASQISNTDTGNTAKGLRINLGITNPTGTNDYAAFFGNGTQNGSIRGDGVGGVTYGQGSDARIKENILDTSMGLDDLMKIGVKDYSMINDPTHTKQTGFIAQDLSKVFKGAVSTNGDDGVVPLASGDSPWMVDYGRVTPLIVKAIQDLNKKVFGTSTLAELDIEELTASTTISVDAKVRALGIKMSDVNDLLAQFASSTQATTTVSTSTDVNGNLLTITERSFFGKMLDNVSKWLSEATNGIVKIFAGEIETKKLCVSDESGNKTCLTKAQLDSLLTSKISEMSDTRATSTGNIINIEDVLNNATTTTEATSTGVTLPQDVLEPIVYNVASGTVEAISEVR